jgi:hypothetical protein
VVEVTTVLEILAVIFAIWVLAVLASLWWLARRNRVARDARTGAPLHWLAAPSRAAAAHRRLRRAVAGAHAGLGAVPLDGHAHAELAVCVSTLERQAVDLDHRLVVAAQCPAATRWKLVRDLEPQIRDVERIGGRLAAIAVLAPSQPAPTTDALDARLAALAEARAELDALDAGERALPAGGLGVVGIAPQVPIAQPRTRPQG